MTSSTCPFTFTDLHSFTIFPFSFTKNVDLSTPIYSLPYIDFNFITSKDLHIFSSGSDKSSKGNDCFSLKFSSLVFNTLIPRNVKLAEAPSHGMSGIKYKPDSYGAKAYLSLAGELIRKIEYA